MGKVFNRQHTDYVHCSESKLCIISKKREIENPLLRVESIDGNQHLFSRLERPIDAPALSNGSDAENHHLVLLPRADPLDAFLPSHHDLKVLFQFVERILPRDRGGFVFVLDALVVGNGISGDVHELVDLRAFLPGHDWSKSTKRGQGLLLRHGIDVSAEGRGGQSAPSCLDPGGGGDWRALVSKEGIQRVRVELEGGIDDLVGVGALEGGGVGAHFESELSLTGLGVGLVEAGGPLGEEALEDEEESGVFCFLVGIQEGGCLEVVEEGGRSDGGAFQSAVNESSSLFVNVSIEGDARIEGVFLERKSREGFGWEEMKRSHWQVVATEATVASGSLKYLCGLGI